MSETKQIADKMSPFNWKDILNFIGTRGIVKNIGFLFYCSVLLMIYITATHTNDNMVRKMNMLQGEIKELNWQFLDEKSKLMFITKESELQKLAASQGLNIITVPHQKIKIIKEQ